MFLEPVLRTERFKRFFLHEIKLWEEIYLDFISLGSSIMVKQRCFALILGHPVHVMNCSQNRPYITKTSERTLSARSSP